MTYTFLSLSHLLSGAYIPEGVADMPLTIHPDDQNAMKRNLITIDQQKSWFMLMFFVSLTHCLPRSPSVSQTG